MNVRTFKLLAATSKSADFETDLVDCQRDSGYSAGIDITSASSLNCTVALHSSAGQNKWAIIPESVITIKSNDTVNYNVSECYYEKFKIVVEMKAGSATFEVNITTKSN